MGFARLSSKSYGDFLIIEEVFRQQQQMWKRREYRIEDRIMSCSQSPVRPIFRGKASASTEFGFKLSVSLVNGIARINQISWDSFNESSDLEVK